MSKSVHDVRVPVPSSSGYFNSPAWYLRERVPVQTVKDRRTRKYFSLETVTSPRGVTAEVLVERDYPITPDYVSSFAASADFRQDPLGAIASAKPKTNLGDITKLQEALSLDFETARKLYAEFRAAAKRSAELGAQKQDPASASAAGEGGQA